MIDRVSSSDVVILFGGSSNERRVAVASGQNVASVVTEAALWFLAPGGAVHEVTADELQAFQRPFERDFIPSKPPFAASIDDALDPARVFFFALHGGEGEDGTLQRICEDRRIAFTGPGSAASAQAYDKEVAKQVAMEAGVRIAESVHLPRRTEQAQQVMREMLELHGRIVVKPVAGGSSVGLHHIVAEAQIDPAVNAIEATGEAYLAEAFVAGAELTIGVVESTKGTRALPPSEVRMEAGRAFDFEGKYLGKGTREITPAEVSPEVARASQDLALAAHAALGCEGYSRTDLIVGPRGPVFLELNTLPGLTRMSFIPQQLAADGTPLASFLEDQITLARRRRDR